MREASLYWQNARTSSFTCREEHSRVSGLHQNLVQSACRWLAKGAYKKVAKGKHATPPAWKRTVKGGLRGSFTRSMSPWCRPAAASALHRRSAE